MMAIIIQVTDDSCIGSIFRQDSYDLTDAATRLLNDSTFQLQTIEAITRVGVRHLGEPITVL